MDSQQAKETLELYRPGVDETDPQFTEALAQVERDPELRRWFDNHCALYAVIRAKMKDVRVPVDLRDQILGEREVARPVPWWRSPFALRTAVVVVIGLALYSIVLQLGLLRGRTAARRTDFAAFRDEMVYYAAAGYKLDVKSTSLDELRQQFVRNGWPSDYAVPAGLTKLAVRGGCLTKWKEHKVSMLCLRAPDRHGVWLYVTERAALPGAPSQSTPQFATQDNIATASWSEGDKTYLLAAEGNEAFLRTLL